MTQSGRDSLHFRQPDPIHFALTIAGLSFLLCVLLALIGCATGPAIAAQAELAAAPVTTLTIENGRFYDAAVFVVHNGSKARRLDGYVSGNSTRTFVLEASDFTAGQFQLLATYVGDGMTVLSDEIPASYGAHYTWQLGPERGAQFLYPQRSAE